MGVTIRELARLIEPAAECKVRATEQPSEIATRVTRPARANLRFRRSEALYFMHKFHMTQSDGV